MKKWLCVVLLVVFAACQKGVEPFTDSGTNPGGTGTGTSSGIVGTWKFDSLSANTVSTSEYTDMDSDFKSITYSNYITTNNTGTVTFKADSTYSGSNIGYSVDTTANAYDYENGILLDSNFIPFRFSIGNTTIGGNYKLIGSDSIYFPNGFISTSASTPVQSTPSGGIININGNNLTLTQSLYTDTTLDSGGIPLHSVISAKTLITFTRQ